MVGARRPFRTDTTSRGTVTLWAFVVKRQLAVQLQTVKHGVEVENDGADKCKPVVPHCRDHKKVDQKYQMAANRCS